MDKDNFFLIVCATALASPLSHAAPPANDSFEAALPLTGLPAAAEGGNQEATRQSGEPGPPDGYGRASLWWKWTAPAAGWIELNTLESDYDTVLAVYTGTAVNSLTLIKSNDDSASSTRSRLRFLSAAGTEYRVQVQSWFHADGTARLRMLGATAPQPPVLQRLTLNPGAVTISTDSPYIDLLPSIEFLAPDGLADVHLTLAPPDGAARGYWNGPGEIQEIPGNTGAGVYRNALGTLDALSGRFEGLSNVGDWTVRVVLKDNFGETTAYGGQGEPPLPAGSDAVLKVTGDMADFRPPVITSAKATPEVIDVTSGTRTLTLEVAANDDEPLGGLEADLLNPAGDGVARSDYNITLSSGTLNNGVWTLKMEIPANLTPGIYLLAYQASSPMGLVRHYSPRNGTPLPQGVQASVTIVNSGGPDDTVRPRAKSLTFAPARVSAETLPVQVKVRMEIEEDQGGQSASVSINSPVQQGGYSVLQLISRVGTTEIWEGTMTMRKDLPPGIFTAGSFVADKAGNSEFLDGRAYYGDPAAAALLPASQPVFIITPGPQDAYSVWRKTYPGLTDAKGEFDADPDGDGSSNAVEFLCGTHPLLPSTPHGLDPEWERAPRFSAASGTPVFEFRLSSENIKLGEGTYWRLKSSYSETPDRGWWPTQFAKSSGKGLFRAELPVTKPKGFLRLVLETDSYTLYPYGF